MSRAAGSINGSGEEKSKGKTVTLRPKAAPPVTEVIDLMQRLKDSIANTQNFLLRSLPAP